MKQYKRGGIVLCSCCSQELQFDDSVYLFDGETLCEECFAEEMSCDTYDASDVADENGVDVTTAEDFLENDYLCAADLECDCMRDERAFA